MTKERAHAKFNASGAERWFECPGSVELSEGQPDKSGPWAIEGTEAHNFLEAFLLNILGEGPKVVWPPNREEMRMHVERSAGFILGIYGSTPDAKIMVETRVYLDFIDPEMFGTFDSAVIDYFGTLHVFDFKYGAGVPVSPIENLQMIFYGIGVAHKFKWNFKKVRLWIIQPRIKGYDGPTFWDVPILKLKAYVEKYREAVKRVKKFPNHYSEGAHCWWCKAKPVCPLKIENKRNEGIAIFKAKPIDKN